MKEEEKKLFKRLALWCSRQERSYREVTQKLETLDASYESILLIAKALQDQNFQNDVRFAQAFSGGKFRIKHWGKMKIRKALQEKGISPENIILGLKEIDLDDYYKTAEKLIEKKLVLLQGEKPLVREAKIYKYMNTKGYESSLVREILSDLQRTFGKETE
ncbi:MAG: regulatory protein RecX [Bacteroidia bacterium]